MRRWLRAPIIVVVLALVIGTGFLVLGEFSLFGHTGAAKAAGPPFAVSVASIPGAAASGVTGTIDFDAGGGGGVV
ncbi:MAG: hypothetical protein ABSG55_09995, partial [Dehalococcoidia bacterium]